MAAVLSLLVSREANAFRVLPSGTIENTAPYFGLILALALLLLKNT